MNICITLCTAKRPQMLMACLESITSQHVPEGINLHIVVVENDAEENCKAVVLDALGKSEVSFTYVLERKQGIPIARNTSVETALEAGADWIAFVDDDEILEPGWLTAMAGYAASGSADVYTGPVISVFPPNVPDWVEPPRDLKKRQTGAALKTAATNNTLASANLFNQNGGNLRFDLDFRFTGGSDGELFRRARSSGYKIVWVNEAVVRETVPESRLTKKWQLERAKRVASNRIMVSYKHRGSFYTLSRFAPKLIGRFLSATLIKAPLSLITMFDAKQSALHRFGARKKLATCSGILFGLLNKHSQPYRVIEGN